ncbi:MAG: hypothetical protein CMJ53_00300 [Planctomycetaceae bacterium]|nr:hypothetical protein [Planctomycetaceae bacterium]
MITQKQEMEDSEVMFEGEYAIELDGWFRRRFRNLCIGLLCILTFTWGLGIMGIVASMFLSGLPSEELSSDIPGARFLVYACVAGTFEFTLILWFFVKIRPRLQTRKQLISAATKMMRYLSIFEILAMTLLYQSEMSTLLTTGVWEIFFWHFLACLFLPWTAWESLKALGPAYVLCFLIISGDIFLNSIAMGQNMTVTTMSLLWMTFVMTAMVIFFIPGMLICWMRLRKHGRRFKFSLLNRKYLDLRQDMANARKIHDALFPGKHEDAQIAFDFSYTPYSEIGGDFVWFERSEEKVLIMLLDVTGHGLPAAMTVNRIHGEIERLRSEYPGSDPLVLMNGLGRYFSLTMSRHQIFATGITCELELETGALKWVNAGHPPGFIISRNGRTVELGTTAMMLGAGLPDEFEVEQEETVVMKGDLIGLYTDGVTEARSSKGELLGLKRMRRLANDSNVKDDWVEKISTYAQEFSRGLIDDDILVASLKYRDDASQDMPEMT